jgi:hypothetical protein
VFDRFQSCGRVREKIRDTDHAWALKQELGSDDKFIGTTVRAFEDAGSPNLALPVLVRRGKSPGRIRNVLMIAARGHYAS